MTHPSSGHRFNVPGARELRGRQTSPEVRLWAALRNRGLAGLKFRRQHPIGSFVADFCCPDRRLIIEVDGAVHDTRQEQDAEREALLVAAGYRVMRVRNEEIMNSLDTVLAQILATAEHLPIVPPAERRRSDI